MSASPNRGSGHPTGVVMAAHAVEGIDETVPKTRFSSGISVRWHRQDRRRRTFPRVVLHALRDRFRPTRRHSSPPSPMPLGIYYEGWDPASNRRSQPAGFLARIAREAYLQDAPDRRRSGRLRWFAATSAPASLTDRRFARWHPRPLCGPARLSERAASRAQARDQTVRSRRAPTCRCGRARPFNRPRPARRRRSAWSRHETNREARYTPSVRPTREQGSTTLTDLPQASHGCPVARAGMGRVVCGC
jgi:hypothetical protein